MTEDRWRPLTAFALVSLLCAVVVAVNLGGARAGGVVRAHASGGQIATSTVVFGDVLHPQAGSVLGITLGEVGPLSGAVSRAATGTPTANASHAHKAHKSRVHKARSHRATKSHRGTVTKGKARKTAAATSTRPVRSTSAKAVKARSQHQRATHVRHAWRHALVAAHRHGNKFRWPRGHHIGWTHNRGHHRGWGHHGGWAHRHH